MRITWDKDTRTLSAGAAFALVCGLMLGGAMRPDLGDDGRPAGPQMIAGWSATRSTGPFDPGATFASYNGQVPDYVTGTDWKRRTAWPYETAAVSKPAQEPVVSERTLDDDPPDWARPVTRAAYEDPPPPPPRRYPSEGGGLGPDEPEAPAPTTTG